MHKLNIKMMVAAAMAAALVAACGGRNDDDPVVDPASQVGQSVQKTIDFISNLIANNGENSDAIDVNGLTLAVDDTAEPTPL